MKTGIELIIDERNRQVEKEGWTSEHDLQHEDGVLAGAAFSYLIGSAYEADNPPPSWPFEKEYWKPSPDDRVSELVKAGALIAAEIDNILNKKQYEPNTTS